MLEKTVTNFILLLSSECKKNDDERCCTEVPEVPFVVVDVRRNLPPSGGEITSQLHLK